MSMGAKFLASKNNFIKLSDIKFYICGMVIVIALHCGVNFFYHFMHSPSECNSNLFGSIKATPSSQYGKVNTSYAAQLSMNINVFCVILTTSSLYKAAYSAQNTWIRRCTDYGFVGDRADSNIHFLNNRNSKMADPNSWHSLRFALLFLRDKIQHMHYFVKADNDTYMIMENLRYMLELEDPTRPFLIGHLSKPTGSYGRLFGSAGYVISKGAMQAILDVGMHLKSECSEQTALADVQLELCAKASGVVLRDSFDFLGKSRFSSVPIFDMLGPYPNNTPRWYPAESDYTQEKFNLSKLPASPFLVSFKGIDDTMMYVLEYLLYHLRPSGITHRWLSAVKR